MRTTLNLNAHHLERAKQVAADRGHRLSDVVNEALAVYLVEAPSESEEPRCVLPVFRGGVGEQPLEPDDLKDLLVADDLDTLERIPSEGTRGAFSRGGS